MKWHHAGLQTRAMLVRVQPPLPNLMDCSLAGDASPALKAGGAERPGFRLRLQSAIIKCTISSNRSQYRIHLYAKR